MSWTDNGLTFVVAGEAHHIYTLTLVIAAAVSVIVLATVWIFLRSRSTYRGADGCVWRRGRDKDYPTLTRWQCRDCGRDAYTADREPPKECKRKLQAIL